MSQAQARPPHPAIASIVVGWVVRGERCSGEFDPAKQSAGTTRTGPVREWFQDRTRNDPAAHGRLSRMRSTARYLTSKSGVSRAEVDKPVAAMSSGVVPTASKLFDRQA